MLEDKDRSFDKKRKWCYPLPEFSCMVPSCRLPLIPGVYSPSVTVFRGAESQGYPLLDVPVDVSFLAVAAYRRPAYELIDRFPISNLPTRLDKKRDEVKLNWKIAEGTKRKIRSMFYMAKLRGMLSSYFSR